MATICGVVISIKLREGQNLKNILMKLIENNLTGIKITF